MTAAITPTLLVYVGGQIQRCPTDFAITAVGEIYFSRRRPAQGEEIQMVYGHGDWIIKLPLLYGDGETVVFNQRDEAERAIRQIVAAVQACEKPAPSPTAPLDLDALEAAALAAHELGDWPDANQISYKSSITQDAAELMAAANPAVVLQLIERLRTAEERANMGMPAVTQCPKCYVVFDARLGAAEPTDQRTPIVDAFMERWTDDGATRGAAFTQLRDLARELELRLRDRHSDVVQLDARLSAAETELKAKSQSHHPGELSIIMSMRHDNAMFSVGRHVAPNTLRSFSTSAIDHVGLECSRMFKELQEHIASADKEAPNAHS